VRIIITGSSGFIGQSIEKHFSKDNIIMKLKIRKDVNFHELENKILSFQPEIFIHCGWDGGNSFSDIDNSNQLTNVEVGIRILKTISKIKNLYFIGLGSFSEYGNLTEPATEKTPEHPSSLYGLSKYMFKQISESMCTYSCQKWLWVRPCYVYGPNDVKTRLIPKVIDSLLDDKEIVLDSCDTVVDYIYIEDFVSALHELIKECATGCYNICSGQQYSIKDVVLSIKQKIKKGNILFDSSIDRKKFQKYICGSNEKLLKKTSWHQQYEINKGIEKTIYFTKQDKK